MSAQIYISRECWRLWRALTDELDMPAGDALDLARTVDSFSDHAMRFTVVYRELYNHYGKDADYVRRLLARTGYPLHERRAA